MMIHHVVLINTEDLLMPRIITRARTRVVWSSGRGRLVDRPLQHRQSEATNQHQHLAGRGEAGATHRHNHRSLKWRGPDLVFNSTWAEKQMARRNLIPLITADLSLLCNMVLRALTQLMVDGCWSPTRESWFLVSINQLTDLSPLITVSSKQAQC